jgi:hypothetical protein
MLQGKCIGKEFKRLQKIIGGINPMLRKGLALLAMALFAAPLFADIELSTSINDVFNRGTNELAGSITMRVQDNDFSAASTTEPVFIRVTLDHQAELADTLVDLTSNDDPIDTPIYLAMRVNTASGNVLNVADTQSVSIVRWVGGESAFWIRVQTPSDEWISLSNGSPVLPQENITVSWSMGISARRSAESLTNVSGDLINLPFNTRDAFTDGSDEDAVSTLICVDLSGSNLTTTGIESLLNYDPIAYDETAEVSLGVYRRGADTGINFTNDFAIARGKNRECTVGIADKGAPAVSDVCIPRAGLNQDLEGWLTMSNNITFEIDCERGGEFLDTDLYPGAYVTFSTGGRGLYGFEDNSASFTVDSFSEGFNHFEDHDRDLYSGIDVIYDGGFDNLDDYDLTANVTLYYYYTNGPVDVLLDYSITLVNHEGERDVAPYNGADQDIRCLPSEFVIATGEWDFGSFVECAGVPAVAFFPYLPILQGNELFWAGLSVVNQGGVDLDVEAIVYHDNGARFTAELGELAAQNQKTFLIAAGDDGVPVFQNANDDSQVSAVPSDEVVAAEDFGTTRSNMFVRGTFEAIYSDDVFAGDLDGYLLIGKGGDIDGSYLPRNYDNDMPGQNADLPLARSKKAVAPVVNKMGETKAAKYHFNHGKWVNK